MHDPLVLWMEIWFMVVYANHISHVHVHVQEQPGCCHYVVTHTINHCGSTLT